jgi:threonyl-tRNA synthetase
MSCCGAPQEPSFLDTRLAKWQEIQLRRQAERISVEEKPITITLPDGSTRPGIAGKTTPMEIAKGISSGLAKKVIIAKVDDATWDLERALTADCKLQLLDFDTPEGKNTFWHSAAHILGQALEIEENAHLCSGPPVEEGFYYDVWMGGKQVSESFLKLYEARAQEIIKANQPFERLELTKEEALELFAYNQFKCRIISSKIPDGAWCSAYRCGPLIDLCRGPHVPSTGRVATLAVTKNSSAYFLSNSENESLQRVYGVAFPDSKQMKEYQFRMEEAAKRDHRRIGITQDLFRFNELSPGSAFFSPMGTRLYNTLIEFMRKQYVAPLPSLYLCNILACTASVATPKSRRPTFSTCSCGTSAATPRTTSKTCLCSKWRSRSTR